MGMVVPGGTFAAPGRYENKFVRPQAATCRSSQRLAQTLAQIESEAPEFRAGLRWQEAHVYFRMLTARATTRTASTKEMDSSDIMASLAQDLIPDTSEGLSDAAVLNDRCR